MINEDIIHFTQFTSNNAIYENKQYESDDNFNPFLAFADSIPVDFLKSLHLLFSDEAFEQASKKCIDVILYHLIKNKKNVSLSTLISSLENQSFSYEQIIFNLQLIKTIINKTPIEDELDIPPNFFNFIANYFPHSLSIYICSDLIQRDIAYYQQFSQFIITLDQDSSKNQNCFLSYNNFFLHLMKHNLYDTLILLQSFLLYKENIIYMEPIFEEILSIISSREIKEKIECFNTLSNFFECDDLYYSKLISNQSRLSSIFSNLEKNSSLIESSLNFANEVTYSNNDKIIEFITIAKLDQMIINILTDFNDQKIIFFCCKICERLIQSDGEKGIAFLFERNIIYSLNSIRPSISVISFQNYMHMITKIIIKGTNSQISSILAITPLIDFGTYADFIYKEEATPFLMKIATKILNDYETTGKLYYIDEDTYDELCSIAQTETNEENKISEFLNCISPLLELNGLL